MSTLFGGIPRRAVAGLAIAVGAALAVFLLTAAVSRWNWELAAMCAVFSVLILLVLLVALGALRTEESTEGRTFGKHRPPPVDHAPPPPAAPEAGSNPVSPAPAGEEDRPAAAAPAVPQEPDEKLLDRYYYRGAWFDVTVHQADAEGHRIDLAGPLCPSCHEPMHRATDREPMQSSDGERTEVYRCGKSHLHHLLEVQLDGPGDLMEQARSACLHEMSTGAFQSEVVEPPKPPESPADAQAPETPGSPEPEPPVADE